jgi:hypothetical protein
MLEGGLDSVNQSAVCFSPPSSFAEQLVPPAVPRIVIPPPNSSSEDEGYNPSDDEAPDELQLYDWMVDLGSHRTRPHFVGKTSSGIMILKDVIELKHHLTGAPLETAFNIVGGIRARRPYHWQLPPVSRGIRLSFDLPLIDS